MVVAVRPEKPGRARGTVCSSSDLVLAGAPITYDEPRSLVGLIEHLVVFVGGDRALMDGLRGGNIPNGEQSGPATTMVFVGSQLEQFKVWRRILLNAAGCHMTESSGRH